MCASLCACILLELISLNSLLPQAPLHEKEQYTVSLRHALVARAGHLLLAADYSQIELRLLAHMASDQPLLQLLNNGEDVFTLLATRLLPTRTHPSEVTPEQRHQAKQVLCLSVYCFR